MDAEKQEELKKAFWCPRYIQNHGRGCKYNA